MSKIENANNIVSEFKEHIKEAKTRVEKDGTVKVNLPSLSTKGFDLLKSIGASSVEIKRSGTGIVIIIAPNP